MPCAYTGSTRPLRVHVTSRTKMAVVFRSNRAATHQRIRAANKPNIRFIFGTSNSSPTMWICKYKFRTERQFIRSSGILFVIVHAQPPSRKDSSGVAQKSSPPPHPSHLLQQANTTSENLGLRVYRTELDWTGHYILKLNLRSMLIEVRRCVGVFESENVTDEVWSWCMICWSLVIVVGMPWWQRLNMHTPTSQYIHLYSHKIWKERKRKKENNNL